MIQFYEAPDKKIINLKDYHISLKDNNITFTPHNDGEILKYSYETEDLAIQHFRNIKTILINGNMKFYRAYYLDEDCYEVSKYFRNRENAIKYLEKLRKDRENNSNIFHIPDGPQELMFDDDMDVSYEL